MVASDVSVERLLSVRSAVSMVALQGVLDGLILKHCFTAIRRRLHDDWLRYLDGVTSAWLDRMIEQ